MIKQRDIVLVPFPFSDQSGQKVRPVLVVSHDRYNNSCDDLIVCGITSVLKKNEFTMFITQKDLADGVLYAESAIKIDNILKINKKLIIKKIAAVKPEVFSHVKKYLQTLF